MKTVTVPIDAFSRGLVPKENVRNVLYLTESVGAFPYEGVLITCEDYSAHQLNLTSLACSFPYPQIFVLSKVTLICTPTKIYEYPNITTAKITVTSGCLWTVADYKTFILLTNGQVMVKKDAETGVYSLDTDRPFGTCVADFNGQAFLTSPDVAVSGNI